MCRATWLAGFEPSLLQSLTSSYCLLCLCFHGPACFSAIWPFRSQLLASSGVLIILLMRSRVWVVLSLGGHPLSQSEYTCSILGLFVFPGEKARCRVYFLEGISASVFFSLRKTPVSGHFSQLQLGWTDRDRSRGRRSSLW